jgi:hypothetical protein
MPIPARSWWIECPAQRRFAYRSLGIIRGPLLASARPTSTQVCVEADRSTKEWPSTLGMSVRLPRRWQIPCLPGRPDYAALIAPKRAACCDGTLLLGITPYPEPGPGIVNKEDGVAPHEKLEEVLFQLGRWVIVLVGAAPGLRP